MSISPREQKFEINTNFISFDNNCTEPLYSQIPFPSVSLTNPTLHRANTELQSLFKTHDIFTHSTKLTLSLNGTYFIPETNAKHPNQFIYPLLHKQIIYNTDLLSDHFDLTDFYSKSTTIQLLTEFQSNSTAQVTNTPLLTKYTNIISNYIQTLHHNVNKIINNSTITSDNNKEKYNLELLVIQRFYEEIFTLELIKVLFLNPFPHELSHMFNDIDNELLYKYRRKYLTDLLVNNLKINCEECIDKTDDVIDKIKLGLLYGQIKTVIKIANENNLPFIALMLSKLNDAKGKAVFQKQLNITFDLMNYNKSLNDIYSVLGISPNTNELKCVLHLKKMTWKSVLVQLLLFTEERNANLSEHLLKFKHYCESEEIFTKEQYETDINFILLMLYSAIERNDINEQNEMIKLLASSKNMFYENNSNNSNHSDHHVQYFISLVLFEVLSEMGNSKNINGNLLRKLHMKLLNKFIEETMLIKDDDIHTHITNFIELLPIHDSIKTNLQQCINVNNNINSNMI